MASASLSPKKYIETKARTLPIYKCLINKDWKEAHEANVIVMRRHVNGNVTAGIYLVDLLCLGIKDTFYFFNEPEEESYNRFPVDVEEVFETIDYSLAHNIIYAGYDFALEFDIAPSKEFAVTKYLLQEDNDEMPLIDIAVGDSNGLPHLVVHQPGEYSSALAKLQKIAGDGNFRYTITGLTENDFDDEDENGDGSVMADYEFGRLTPLAATFLSDEELNDFDKSEDRTDVEKITLLTEQTLRNVKKKQPVYFTDDIEETEEYELIDDSEAIACGITGEEENSFLEEFENNLIEADANVQDNEKKEEYFRSLLDKYADKLLIITAVFESEWNANGSLLSVAKARLEDLQIHPLARLDLALANLLEATPAAGFEDIYEHADIKKLFTGADLPGDKDIAVFWLIQVLLQLKKNDIKTAIYYYRLYSDVNTTNFMLPAIQVKLIEAINKETGEP